MLLTQTASLPEVVVDAITRLAPHRVYTLGGTAVIDQVVQDQVAALMRL